MTSPRPKDPARTAALFAVWLVCTAINFGKAAHIDDAAHLEIARWIAAHPLHPMQGLVMWGDRLEPIHALNQPHLFFYLLAAGYALAPGSLLVGHAIVAGFVAIAIVCFERTWTLLVGARGALLATALVFLGPGFVPGQNLMTDAPLLAMWLAFGLALVRARGDRAARNLAIAAAIAGLACLVKYTSLVLLPVLAFDVWLRGPAYRRQLAVLAIPVAILGLWSAFNVFDYGGVHLIDRPLEVNTFTPLQAFGITLGRGALWTLTLGAIVPFAIALLPGLLARSQRAKRCLIFATIAAVILTALTQVIAAYGPAEMRGEPIAHSAARSVFFVLGVAVLALAWRAVRGARGGDPDTQRAIAVSGFWIAATALFVVVLSPFVAVRHVMLVVPLLTIVLGRAHLDSLRESSSRPALIIASALTIGLGIMLGISDRRWAAQYRDAAARYREESAHIGVHPPWFVGHWGWQWHAAAQGLRAYRPEESELATGDWIIRPRLVDQPAIAARDQTRISLVRADMIDAGPLDWLRTTTARLGYYSVWQGLPYTVSVEPVEIFELWEVR